MAVTKTYSGTGSDSVGWTCQQLDRLLDAPGRPSVAVDTTGDANDVGTGAADHTDGQVWPWQG
jgi:hypothetical protein